MKKCRAFTLVELLVVIAIISILAALLLPALAKTREMSQTAACSSIEKQWGLAFINFRNDYDDYMPAKRFTPILATTAALFPPPEYFRYNSSNKWSEDINEKELAKGDRFLPYYNALRKALCPSHPSRDTFYASLSDGVDKYSQCSTYLWSDYYTSIWTYSTGTGLNNDYGRRPVRAMGVAHHDRKFLLLEVEKYDYYNSPPMGTSNYDSWVFYYNTAGTMTYLGYHHNGYNGFNALFFDGHVSFYKFRASPTSRTDGELVEENFHD